MPGRSVRLFLADGTAHGIRTAELGNWSGKGLAAPRTELAAIGKRTEVRRTGVYLLLGPDEDSPSGLATYVGEGDEIYRRLVAHDKDPKKEFWTNVILFVSKDDNLTKAHARWLESRLVDNIRKAKQATVTNGNDPGGGKLPEADEADMETFFENLSVLLPLLGADVVSASSPKPTVKAASPSPKMLVMKYKKAQATCRVEGGKFWVLEGSTANVEGVASLAKGHLASRNWLVAQGVLTTHPSDSSLWVFTADHSFESPSAAAANVSGASLNGRITWKLKGRSSMSYKIQGKGARHRNAVQRNAPRALLLAWTKPRISGAGLCT